MSTPTNVAGVRPLDALQVALGEIISAESSLNMYPEPLHQWAEVVTGEGYGDAYLSQTDANAAHAMEHLRAAFALVNKAHQAQESLKLQVYALVSQLKKLGHEPCRKTWLDEIEWEVPAGA